jgi:hypothetical protein
MFEQSKLIFGLVKLTPYYEVHIYTQGKIFVEDDISVYEYSKIRVRKCSALSHGFLSLAADGETAVATGFSLAADADIAAATGFSL